MKNIKKLLFIFSVYAFSLFEVNSSVLAMSATECLSKELKDLSLDQDHFDDIVRSKIKNIWMEMALQRYLPIPEGAILFPDYQFRA